jgi:hypothetical protein
MSLEVKNIQVARNLSDETLAFSASLWLDGRRVGEVRNQGVGGSNTYDVSREDMDRLEELARGAGHTFEPVDALVDEQVSAHELARDVRAMRRRGAEVVVLVKRGHYSYPAHDGGEPVTGFSEELLVGGRAGTDPAKLAEDEGAEEWRTLWPETKEENDG